MLINFALSIIFFLKTKNGIAFYFRVFKKDDVWFGLFFAIRFFFRFGFMSSHYHPFINWISDALCIRVR